MYIPTSPVNVERLFTEFTPRTVAEGLSKDFNIRIHANFAVPLTETHSSPHLFLQPVACNELGSFPIPHIPQYMPNEFDRKVPHF